MFSLVLENALSPMDVTVPGRSIEVKEHPENTESPMVVRALGNLTDVIPVQPENTPYPNTVTPVAAERSTDVIMAQPLNALSPMDVRDAGKLTESSLLHPTNAAFPMLCMPYTKVTDVSPVQLLNALGPTVSTEPGREMAVMETQPLKALSPIALSPVPHSMFFSS